MTNKKEALFGIDKLNMPRSTIPETLHLSGIYTITFAPLAQVATKTTGSKIEPIP